MEYIAEQQIQKCLKYSAEYLPAEPDLTIGISKDLFSGKIPFNGLRHPPASGTSGWFLWSGLDIGSDPNFFMPVHLYHLLEISSPIIPFLGLAPGWRFLTDGISEDVWYEESLLNV